MNLILRGFTELYQVLLDFTGFFHSLTEWGFMFGSVQTPASSRTSDYRVSRALDKQRTGVGGGASAAGRAGVSPAGRVRG